MARGSLPVASCNDFVRIDRAVDRQLASRGGGHRDRTRFVRFEDFETAQFLVEQGEGLKALGLENLLVEPGLDLILGLLGKLLVSVVDMSVQLKERDLLRKGS